MDLVRGAIPYSQYRALFQCQCDWCLAVGYKLFNRR